MREHDVAINGIRLHCRETGNGSALLLIHGFTVAGQFWDSMVPFLAEDHRVIVVDLPGHGRSTSHPGPYRYRQVAADMYGLLDHLGLREKLSSGFLLPRPGSPDRSSRGR